MSDDKRESYDAYMSRMMREQSKKSNNHATSNTDAIKEDMKRLTEAYYEAMKRKKKSLKFWQKNSFERNILIGIIVWLIMRFLEII